MTDDEFTQAMQLRGRIQKISTAIVDARAERFAEAWIHVPPETRLQVQAVILEALRAKLKDAERDFSLFSVQPTNPNIDEAIAS